MNTLFYILLFIFWTLFWSFASVLIYRIKSWEGWIIGGRSHCKTCERDLSALELVPILSWLFQVGKCKWCKQKISGVYPLLELSTWVLFTLTWVFLISSDLVFSWNILEWFRLIFFLSIMFLTIIYVFYDILYMEIPESILLSANILTFIGLIFQWIWYSIIPYLPVWWINIGAVILCLWVLWVTYYIMLAGLREIYDCLLVVVCMLSIALYMYWFQVGYGSSALLSGTIAALWIFISFFLQIILSGWRAMGGWDLRIALLAGLLTWVWFAFQAWMLCYLAWSIIWVWIVLKSKIQNGIKWKFQHQIPFWPFIACWYLWVLFFHSYIVAFMSWYF